MPPRAPRPICGWEIADGASPRVVAGRDQAPAGAYRVVLSAADATPFSALRDALGPARATLVRVKIAVAGRWLLPLTLPQRPVDFPDSAPKTVRIVGSRKVTSLANAPARRLAEIRLDGDRATLVLEAGSPRGQALPVADLAAELRRAEPPVDTFMLGVSDATRFADFVRAVAAAACYDLGPGDEPHEVVLELRAAR